MSEATLFSLSGGRKIPHSRHVLVGLVPLTIDALVRVMGQALVLTYIPVCLFLALLKLVLTLKLAGALAYGRHASTLSSDDGHFEGVDRELEKEHFHQKTKKLVINGLAGLVCPVPNSLHPKLGRSQRGAQKILRLQPDHPEHFPSHRAFHNLSHDGDVPMWELCEFTPRERTTQLGDHSM